MPRQFFVLTFLCCLLFTESMFAQQKTSGIIYYSQVIDTKASGGGQVTIAGGGNFSMPDKITNKFELIFNSNGAKFQRSTVDEQLSAGSGGGMIMRMGSAARTIFFNFAEEKATESFDLDAEALLLETKLGATSADAEKAEETREIIGFKCKKAVHSDKAGNQTIVWYTTDLPVKASPLPGMWVEGLVLGIENNRMKYYATSIDYLKVNDKEFALPKKARMITQEEYKQKMDELRSKIQQRGSVRFGG